MICILYKMSRNTVVNLHIYGARSIFLLFHDDQDTEFELCQIQMIKYQLISTHKNIPMALWENGIHTIQNGERKLR